MELSAGLHDPRLTEGATMAIHIEGSHMHMRNSSCNFPLSFGGILRGVWGNTCVNARPFVEGVKDYQHIALSSDPLRGKLPSDLVDEGDGVRPRKLHRTVLFRNFRLMVRWSPPSAIRPLALDPNGLPRFNVGKSVCDSCY